MIQFNAVQKNKDFFISTPTEEYLISLTNVDINHTVYSRDGKMISSFKINEDKDKALLNSIEKHVLNVVISNNKDWFNNDLLENDITERYVPSFDTQTNIIGAIVHPTYKPKLLGFDTDDLYEIFDNHSTNNKKTITNAMLRLVGIYIKKDQFYVRWLLKQLEEVEIDVEDINNLENEFETKYTKMREHLDKQINHLTGLRDSIDQYYSKKDFEGLTKSFYLILDKT